MPFLFVDADLAANNALALFIRSQQALKASLPLGAPAQPLQRAGCPACREDGSSFVLDVCAQKATKQLNGFSVNQKGRVSTLGC